jgi:hypothetical protein
LKGAWFQTLTLEHQSWFQNVPLQMQPCDSYSQVVIDDDDMSSGGALHVEIKLTHNP